MTDRQINDLSERELEILRLVATGASNKEIAQQLYISANTVKVHLRNIFSKIGVASRTEAALYSIRLGLVDAEKAAPIEEIPSHEPGEVLVEAEGPAQENWQSAPVFHVDQPASAAPARRGWMIFGLFVVLVILGAGIFATVQGGFTPAPTPGVAAPPVQRWQSAAGLPTPRFGLAAAAHEGYIFAIGGRTPSGASSTVERFDPESNTWEERSPKNVPVSQVNAAVLGGLIYVPGGCQQSGLPSSVLEVYDPRLDAWQERASLPVALCAYSLAAFEGRLFLFGGWDGDKYRSDVFIYDPSRDLWLEGTPLSRPRGYSAAVVALGKIFVLGGYDGVNALSVNEVYYPERDQPGSSPWENASALPEGRYAMGVASFADSIYLFGGKRSTGGRASTMIYLPQSNEWLVVENLDLAESEMGVASVGPFLYAMGGGVNETPVSTNQTYQAIYTLSIPVIVK
jgi:DNA-binding CsgD family transcriptional regulator/N-acetylneuraminic acid mutarotase